MSSENPILNNPYREPELHYETSLQGELDYEQRVRGRRLFTPDHQSIPVRQGNQRHLISLSDLSEVNHADHIVNLLRREVKQWREAEYPASTVTRVTRELLVFWFQNPERDFTQSLFFAQQEAIETAIWLNEVAPRSNVGQRILSDLEKAQAEYSDGLPRTAFKMATGTGKTVVMGALILYHFFNRNEYRSDTRFADNFLLVAPGITIRDRLGVLRVDAQGGATAADYYTERTLVPSSWRHELQQLNARIAIVNFHAFLPRTLSGNKASPFDGKRGADGKKREARDSLAQTVAKALKGFKPNTRLLILNDEAHHCYLPRDDERKAEGEDAKEENQRAAIWFSGIREISRRYKVGAIYDLSATPYYLTGSGYTPYSLFPWVVSDFGLIEAIESGLVKIPYIPVSDTTQAIGMPVLRDLYEHAKKEGLPKAGQKVERKRAKEKGEQLKEAPPRLPTVVKAAFAQFYDHYQKDHESRDSIVRASGSTQLALDDTPPVFIVVCNNTSVSKEVYKYIAGYEQTGEDGAPLVVPGVYDLFSNYDPSTRRLRQRPPTLLIDSDALENSEQISAEFKQVFAREIELFKRDYARLHGAAAAEQITESEMLREVVNTVGKPNTLGAHIRCVVSVSMLTEGWDANTVTHIAGLRAFGSQLLCEQVAGRALRRKSYFLQGYDKNGEPTDDKRRIATYKYPPEYAHIIGVPFKMFKGGKATQQKNVSTTPIHPLPERAAQYEIIFPRLEGYRMEYSEAPLTHSFNEKYEVDASKLPTTTEMGTAVDGKTIKMSVEHILEIRDQQIIYGIAKEVLRSQFSDDEGNLQFHRFHELTRIVRDWYENNIQVLHKGPEWKKLVYFHEAQRLVSHIAGCIETGEGGESRIRPILNYYNPTGSTRFAHGATTKEVYPTNHSHINGVVIDSGWEGNAAKVLDDLAAEGKVLAWAKNAFLDFRIPYTDSEGENRDYLPDFIVRAKTSKGEKVNLILEITGEKRDKTEKKQAVENRWLPAVNAIREQHDWDRWDFLEIAGDIRDARNDILGFLGR